MSFDPASNALSVAVVSSGAMGRGIAQIAAQAGVRALMHDAMPGAAAKAREALLTTFDTLRAKGKLSEDEARRAGESLHAVDDLRALAGADLVIEAIVEDLGAKRTLFRQLEATVRPQAVLATNTSSLSVTAIATACERPQRVAGYHFFNPVPLMKVVEVVAAVKLGLGYPQGPLAWGDRLGASTVLAILDNMLRFTGDPRYRASPWLRRRAQLGVSLHYA